MSGSAAEPSHRVRPLLRSDPPRLGEISLSGRLEVTAAGIVYAGVLADQPVAVALLTEGAETDSYARARFSDAVRDARLEATSTAVVAGEDEPDVAPWVAVRADSWDDGATLAGALLAPATLEDLPPVGRSAGPSFRPGWSDRSEPGRWRAWPLPWPAVLSGVGRWTYAASFAIVLAISAVALFIAVQLFRDAPPAPVNPPFPQPTTGPNPTEPTPTPTPSTSPTTPPPTSSSPSTIPGSSPGNTSIV